MALFDIREMPVSKTVCDGSGFVAMDIGHKMLGSTILHELISNSEGADTLHFMTNGKWSMHELILGMMDKYGVGDLYFSTWTIKEKPCKALISAMLEGKIRQITGVIDYRVRKQTPEVYELAKMGMANIGLSHCHAKVAVGICERGSWVTVGSSNLTTNPRIECGILTRCVGAAAFHSKWIKDIADKNNKEELWK